MKLDPRVKLAVSGLLTTLAVVRSDFIHLGLAILAGLLLAALLRWPFWQTGWRLKKLLAAFGAILLLQAIFTRQGQPLLGAGSFTLFYSAGISLALQFLLRMLVIFLAAGILATSDARSLIQGLIQVKIPYSIAFMTTIAIGYIPKLSEEIRDTAAALALRGINWRKISLRRRIQALSTLFAPLILKMMSRAEELAISLDLRGFRLKRQRTSWLKLRLCKADWLVLTVGLSFFVLILVF